MIKLWMPSLCLLVAGLAWADEGGLNPPARMQGGVARDWVELAAQVEQGTLALDPAAEGRLLARAMRALELGNADADRFVSVVVRRRLEPYRREDGTLDWDRVAEASLPTGADGEVHLGLPLFLAEASRAVRTANPGRLEELADRFSRSDLLAQLGVLNLGMGSSTTAYGLGAKLTQPMVLGRQAAGRLILSGSLQAAVGISLLVIAREADALIRLDASRQGVVIPLLSTIVGNQTVKALAHVTLERAPLRLHQRLLRPLYAHRGVRVAVFVGEAILTAILADQVYRWIDDGDRDVRASRPVREAAEALVEAARDHADPEALAAAIDTYQEAWAGYRNGLYQPLGRAEAQFTTRLAELQRQAARRRAKREGLLEKYARFPRLLEAKLRTEGLFEGQAGQDTLAAYGSLLAQRDTDALVPAWTEAARTYSRKRRVLLEEIYHANQRVSAWLTEPAQGRFEADAETWLDAHMNAWTANRLQTYDDELAALRYLFDHLLRGRPELAELREQALRLTRRQADIDGKLFGAPAATEAAATGVPGALHGAADALRRD